MASGTVVILQDRCKGCQLCVEVCPQHVLALNSEVINTKGYHPAELIDPDGACTGCALCAVMCPDVCITIYRAPSRAPRQREIQIEV